MLYEPKLIQIAIGRTASGNSRLFALDEDGNVWQLFSGNEWEFIGSPTAADLADKQ